MRNAQEHWRRDELACWCMMRVVQEEMERNWSLDTPRLSVWNSRCSAPGTLGILVFNSGYIHKIHV